MQSNRVPTKRSGFVPAAAVFAVLFVAASCSPADDNGAPSGGATSGGAAGAAGASGGADAGSGATLGEGGHGASAGDGSSGGLSGGASDGGASGGVASGGAPSTSGGFGGADPTGSGGAAGMDPVGGTGGTDPTGTAGAGGAMGGTGASSQGGAGGNAPEAGAAGSGPECARDEDCIRTEVCISKACEAGRCIARPSCANPDPRHCIAACVPEAEFAQCIVVPRDRDRDGHGDVGCVASTQGVGDDCDDEEPLISVGKAEVCDGIDNNCNQVRDLAELGPGGETQVFRTAVDPAWYLQATPAIWSGEARAFGVAWEEDEDFTTQVYFNLVTSDGDQQLIEPVSFALGDAVAVAPALAYNGSHFGVAWVDYDAAAPGLYFAPVTPSGVKGEPLLVAGAPEFEPAADYWEHRWNPPVLSALADGSFALFWRSTTAIQGRVITPQGTLAGTEATVVANVNRGGSLQGAVMGDRIALVWSRNTGGEGLIEGALLDADLTSLLPNQAGSARLGPPADVLKNAISPAIAASPGGFLLSWREGAPGTKNVLRLMRRGPGLVDELCSSVTETDMRATSLAWLDGGGLFVGLRSEERKVAVTQFDDQCKWLAVADVYERRLEGEIRALALSPAEGGFGLLWTDGPFNGFTQISHRFFGTGLCDSFVSDP